MRFLRPVFTLLKWAAALGGVAGLLYVAYLVHSQSQQRRADEADTAETPKRAANKVIKLGEKLAESHGLADEPATAVEWVQRVPAYGRVVPNPRATSEVRTTFAGTLRAKPGDSWPALGTRLKADEVVGFLDVRVGPQERLDLVTKANEAKARAQGAEEQVRIQQERVKRLEAAGGGVPQSEVDTARTQLTDARTQLSTAKATVKEWDAALTTIGRQGDRAETTWEQSVTAPAAGEVVELTGRPGMAVEPGGLVARVVDFRFALVRLELPPESLTAGPPPEVELLAPPVGPPALTGATNRPAPDAPVPTLSARLVGTAPQVEVNSQFAAYWYEADTARLEGGKGKESGVWRPGLFVKSQVRVPVARPQAAVAVPSGALLYHQGRALVYVRLSPGRFERREVQVLGRDGDHWVLADGVAAGERVVSKRAQVLLSEEFRGEADND